MLFIILVLILILIILGIVIPISIWNNKYKHFVLENSEALKALREINKKYKFYQINIPELSHSYDNENYYNIISCKDYLTYELVYRHKEIDSIINKVLDNSRKYNLYSKEIDNKCVFSSFGDAELLKNTDKLESIEEKMFLKEKLNPTIKFSLKVKLILTNINDSPKTFKYREFSMNDVRDIEYRLSQKRGNYYLDNDIWKSLCNVERGKVTNKMRFAIYERDHYRCRKCGRETKDLEIDHIIPIAKGGKSTYDNLQTLCHRCNYEKGSKIE